jgi:hypothetical protein
MVATLGARGGLPTSRAHDMRRILLVALAIVCTGAATASAAVQKPDVKAIRRALTARLHSQHLSQHWVVCVPNGRVFRGHGIVRCNVNFGEPHITAYCSVLIGGKLLTQFDVKAIPCGSDDAGQKIIIVTS